MKHSPFFQGSTSHLPISIPLPLPIRKPSSIPKSPPLLSSRLRSKFFQIQRTSTRFDIPSQFLLKSTTSWLVLAAAHLPFAKLLLSPPPCFAAETGNLSEKINIESIVVSINDFFNRYPFFVSSLAFIWLVVIPLTQDYLSKCKFIPSYDAFQKLRDDPRMQLLDIRKKKNVGYLKTPNLKLYNKDAVHVEFVEGDEEGFVKDVLKAFGDPGNTALCVLDKQL
ncbi:hypothetical protein HPP92_003443 [Vanilla planifolia]|uniref:Uncharacterized protein n=1 Tax=Vanilla planifolia TaxID=51239 RepID=A0A835S8C9_VANPL|nr:hypothetical protein HPP92_003443 [Vanilla planifolia]